MKTMRKERFALANSWRLWWQACRLLLLLSAISYLPSARAQTTASGQTPARNATALQAGPPGKARMTEPLEKYNMPPAYIYRLETGPRMISQFGLFTSFQVNVDADGNNILGDAANEPSISVDPTDGNKIAVGWRQFDSVQSDFRQAGYGYTTDGGTTWTFPGVLQDNIFRSDPVTNSDETGKFFYLSLLVDTFCGDIWGSTNGGQSWVEQSPDGGAHSGDKEWFTIDRTPTSMGHGFQYHKVRSIFPIVLFGEHSMWLRTATCLSAVETRGAAFGAFAQAMHKTQMSHQLLTRSLRLISAGACCLARPSIRADSPGKSSWQLTAPAPQLTTTFT